MINKQLKDKCEKNKQKKTCFRGQRWEPGRGFKNGQPPGNVKHPTS